METSLLYGNFLTVWQHSHLGISNVEDVVVGVLLMDDGEPLVCGVGVGAHGEQVDVAVPHPRNLVSGKIKI